jgi:hypothetical protein
MRLPQLFCLLLLAAGPAQATGITAQQVLAETDRLRNPERPFSVQITLTEYVAAKPRDSIVLHVYSKQEKNIGQFRSLVRFERPERDVGKLMLRHGPEVWFYDPAASNSVRISPQQRLLGQASNGDVMTANFALDYRAELVGEETVKSSSREDHRCYLLRLRASTDRAVYHGVEYWVDTQTYRPIKGKFYSDSGRLLKIAYYDSYREYLGEIRPTRVLIIDAVDSSRVTEMVMADYVYRDIPEAWYQRSYLPRFRPE